jgi:osmotically inducible protein OsmC
MILALVLHGATYTPTEFTVEAAVTIEPEGEGFRISRSALTSLLRPPFGKIVFPDSNYPPL